MATAAKKMAPVASKSRALQPWEEDMARAAKRQAEVNKPIGMFKRLNVQGGVLMIDEKPVKDNALEVVILAATRENQWYDKPYQAGVAAVPGCYAFASQDGDDPEAEMAPEASCDNRQGDDEGKCADCWANKMASADTGKGKACQNVVRMILTTPDALEGPAEMKEAEARTFKVPVMSVKNWSRYVNELADEMSRPSWGVVTKITVKPDVKSQWQVNFEFVELVNFDGPLYEAMQKRVSAELKNLYTGYPKLEEQEAPPAKASKASGGRPAPQRGAPAKPVAMPTNGAAAKKKLGGKY